MPTIQEFSSALQSSARSNQFQVSLNFPTAVQGATQAMRDSTYLVKSATIPEFTIEDIVLMYRGRQYHEAGEKTFQPWTCTIYNSTNFNIRSALEEWSNWIQDSSSTAGVTTPALYKKDITVTHLDRNGARLRTYKLVGAYPTSVGQIQLDYDNSNQVEMFDCTFTYDYFIVE